MADSTDLSNPIGMEVERVGDFVQLTLIRIPIHRADEIEGEDEVQAERATITFVFPPATARILSEKLLEAAGKIDRIVSWIFTARPG